MITDSDKSWSMTWTGQGRPMSTVRRWKTMWAYARLINSAWKRGMVVTLEARTRDDG